MKSIAFWYLFEYIMFVREDFKNKKYNLNVYKDCFVLDSERSVFKLKIIILLRKI